MTIIIPDWLGWMWVIYLTIVLAVVVVSIWSEWRDR